MITNQLVKKLFGFYGKLNFDEKLSSGYFPGVRTL